MRTKALANTQIVIEKYNNEKTIPPNRTGIGAEEESTPMEPKKPGDDKTTTTGSRNRKNYATKR